MGGTGPSGSLNKPWGPGGVDVGIVIVSACLLAARAPRRLAEEG